MAELALFVKTPVVPMLNNGSLWSQRLSDAALCRVDNDGSSDVECKTSFLLLQKNAHVCRAE